MFKLIDKHINRKYRVDYLLKGYKEAFKKLLWTDETDYKYTFKFLSCYTRKSRCYLICVYDNKTLMVDINPSKIKNPSVVLEYQKVWDENYLEWYLHYFHKKSSIVDVYNELRYYQKTKSYKSSWFEFQIEPQVMEFLKDSWQDSKILGIMCDFLKERDLEYPFFENPTWDNILDYFFNSKPKE